MSDRRGPGGGAEGHLLPLNVLFLCTANSARSVLGESLLNHLGRGRFRGYSAGSHPRGEVNPFALRVIESAGMATSGLRSKSWEEFAGSGAAPMDIVITVCDNAAGEACPIWPGRPASAHWGIADPAAVTGSDETRLAAFRDALDTLRASIERLVGLPVETLEPRALRAKLAEIAPPR